jgi:hypothetical protein
VLRLRTALTLALLSLALSSARAWAFDDFTGTRAIGMGDSGRAYAVGDAGPMLNPSGMSLVKNFQVLEGSYSYASRLHAHTLHASMVDNTSGFGIAGGLYYSYRATEPGGSTTGHGHEAGLALSVPIANRVTFGGTVKYFSLSGLEAPNDQTGGVTFDVGGTVTLLPKLSIAVVGTNLRDLHNSNATQGVGYGVSVIPIPDLVIAADGYTRLTPDNQTGRKGTSVMVGGDLTLGGKFDIRIGGGYDAATANGFAAAGFSAVSEVGAIDAGVRQDLFVHEGSRRATIVAVSLRLFIPSQQPSLTPPGTL